MIDFRVLFSYLTPEGHDRYEFTTVLADNAEEAEFDLRNAHADDLQLEIVQVVESNGKATGYTETQRAAAKAEGDERAKARAALETPIGARLSQELGIDA